MLADFNSVIMVSSLPTFRTQSETIQSLLKVVTAQHHLTRRYNAAICAGHMQSSVPAFALVRSSALLAGFVLCGCSGSPKPEYAATGPRAELALHAESHGNGLRLTWNRDAPILANATAGTLVIEDGDQPRQELPLTGDLLRTGTVLYQPTSNSVRFRLDITSE